ncbi:hypothetical protein [Acinetobacter phage vB_AbaS_TCUP2199]|nr:hypothetical protein [Acinetobacter phage vB_AbaS_TCUP2199]
MIKFATVWVLTVIVTYSGTNRVALTNFQHTYGSREECVKRSEFYRKQNDGNTKSFETYCAPSQIPMVVNK